MGSRPYLPSLRFSLIVLSLLGASGLVYAAQVMTAPGTSSSVASVTPPPDDSSAAAADHSDWQATLYAIQAEEGSSSLPAALSQSTVDALQQAAQSSNLTDTIGKTLLVNLTNAASQGLGPDTPTQDSIIQSALGQVAAAAPTGRTYTQADLNVVIDSTASQKAYGNALAEVFAQNSEQNVQTTLLAVDAATSQDDSSKLDDLTTVEANYRALVTDLLLVPTPQTMVPFQLVLINNFEGIADTYPGMQTLITDPIAGLTAVQQYNSLTGETSDVLASIAQALNKDGILFNKDDPGSVWTAFLAEQDQS
jgi:hypothetical protein